MIDRVFISILLLVIVVATIKAFESSFGAIEIKPHVHQKAYKPFANFKGVNTQKCLTLSSDSITIEYHNGLHSQTNYKLITEQ